MRATALIPGSLLWLLSGCGGIPFVDASFPDRCAAVMQAAMPNAEIEITATSAGADLTRDMNTLVAHVQGTADLPTAGTAAQPSTLAMDCVFHNGVLTAIRWTAGPER
jgi:hypothetical protein